MEVTFISVSQSRGSQRNLNGDRHRGGWSTFKFIVKIIQRNPKKVDNISTAHLLLEDPPLSSGPHPFFPHAHNACHSPRVGKPPQSRTPRRSEAGIPPQWRGGRLLIKVPERGQSSGTSPRGGWVPDPKKKRGGNYHQLLRTPGQKRKDSENGFGQTGGSADLSLEQDRSRRRAFVLKTRIFYVEKGEIPVVRFQESQPRTFPNNPEGGGPASGSHKAAGLLGGGEMRADPLPSPYRPLGKYPHPMDIEQGVAGQGENTVG